VLLERGPLLLTTDNLFDSVHAVLPETCPCLPTVAPLAVADDQTTLLGFSPSSLTPKCVRKGYRIRPIILLRSVLFLTIGLAGLSVEAAEFTRSLDFPPVKLTLDQAAELANGLFVSIQNINDPAKNTIGEVSFQSLKYDATFALPLTPADIKNSPDRVLAFTIRITSSENKISYFVLALKDRTRSLTISGRSHDHVTGLISVVMERLEPYNTWLGGSQSRYFLVFLLYASLFIPYMAIMWKYDSPKVILVAIICFMVLPNAVIWLLPWERLFPGTLITRDEIGFLERNAALFTFLSLLLSIVPIVWQIIIRRPNRRAKGTSVESASGQ
jgi:hypothetical protein